MPDTPNSTPDTETLARWLGKTREVCDTIRAQPAEFLRVTLEKMRTVGAAPQIPMKSGMPLPVCWHWLFFLEAAPPSSLGRDGHAARGEFLPPVALPRRMWAGGRLEFAEPLCIGERIVRKSVIKDIQEKTGRSGELCFVTVRHEFFCENGGLKMSEEHDIVYRSAPSITPATEVLKAAAKPPVAPQDADARIEITADTVMLFRYSALTFNSHRIHYDADYCREVENYPAQVVHGPLIATMLAGLATKQGGAPSRFSYRAVSPLFATQPFRIAVKKGQNGELEIWAENGCGELAMSARTMPA